MSKNNKDHDCGNNQELDLLLGTALSTKLVRDTEQSSTEFEKALDQLFLDSLKNRRELVADELTHLTQEARDETLVLLKRKQIEMLSCVVTRLSAMLSNTLGDSIASFVGHAAHHYEMERSRVVIESIFGSARESSAQQIKEAAAAVTGTDN